ncbi:PQ loop repeat protein [Penicillium capsulatum]|uniref:PQ loop repeat protein n=1 Tax=Penicillium capsulatum TaxID=69766 RepID=A0A9W9IQI9_9EURO|nr:PQ loop repeat protein [Penicillium capsulatum]
MIPPQAVNFNIEALSGICGSISIACWVVVFSPQIIENFRRGSADGLSLLFLIIWLAGDVFNILGAVLQGVLPTMIILAVYYTLADIVLLGQCFYYRGFNIREEFSSPSAEPAQATGAPANEDDVESTTPTERSALLRKSSDHVQREARTEHSGYHATDGARPTSASSQGRRHSITSFRDILNPSVDGTHLSPVTPFIEPETGLQENGRQPRRRDVSTLQTILFNTTAIALVCAAGILGWYVSPGSKSSSSESEPLTMDLLGQIFGYLCAALYLGSRLPQLLLNFRRKSTDGVSLLFFLFACIGNLTYVLSIMAYSPVCKGVVSAANPGVSSPRHRAECRPGEASSLYGRYVLVNLSWLIGSFGTLLLDMAIFVQFFLYRDGKEVEQNSL